MHLFVSALVTGQTTTTIQLTVLREMHDALAIDFSGFLKAFEIVFFVLSLPPSENSVTFIDETAFESV